MRWPTTCVNALEPHLKEFTDLTGIKLNVEMYEDQLSQKLAIELAGKSVDLTCS